MSKLDWTITFQSLVGEDAAILINNAIHGKIWNEGHDNQAVIVFGTRIFPHSSSRDAIAQSVRRLLMLVSTSGLVPAQVKAA